MTFAGVPVGLRTKFSRDGEELFTIVALTESSWSGLPEFTAEHMRTGQLHRFSLQEVLYSPRTRILGEDLTPVGVDQGDCEPVAILWEAAPEEARRRARAYAGHIREVQTGYQSGSADTALPGEPRAMYRPDLPKGQRIAAKCKEMGCGARSLYRWIDRYDRYCEAGLISKRAVAPGLGSRQDPRWEPTSREVKAEYTEKSKPTKSLVVARTNARLVARYGPDGIHLPSDATANRILLGDEKITPLFIGSTKHVRDVAARPQGAYGKLRPTRPGEYLLMDTTRLDVHAMDCQTLKWVGLDLTVAMDWYSKCIVGVGLSPWARAIDGLAVLYEAFRPKAPGANWPEHALWPVAGVPRHILVELEHLDPRSVIGAIPAIVPDNLIVDHGKIFVGAAMHSACRAVGISIAPARLKIPYDKAPVERFFGTVRTGFLQELPGYKGPDVYSRGVHPEKDGFYFIDEMEALLREWIASEYHVRPHEGVGEPGLWSLDMSPAQMLAHGIARAGYIEAPRDPQLAYHFLPLQWRTRQPAGIKIDHRMYNGEVLDAYSPGELSAYKHQKGRWPIRVNPDDIRTVYFLDVKGSGQWEPLQWDMARALEMPMSADGWEFARELVRSGDRPVDAKLAHAAFLKRHELGHELDMRKRDAALRLSREQSSLAADLDQAAQLKATAKKRAQQATAEPPRAAIEAFVDDLDEYDEDLDEDDFDDETATEYRRLEEM